MPRPSLTWVASDWRSDTFAHACPTPLAACRDGPARRASMQLGPRGATARRRRARRRVVAVTGASGFLGQQPHRLARRGRSRRGASSRSTPTPPPTAGREDALLRGRPHAARGRGAASPRSSRPSASTRSPTWPSSPAPTHATAWAHELESVGTMHVTVAARHAQVPQARALVADVALRRAPLEPELPHREAPAARAARASRSSPTRSRPRSRRAGWRSGRPAPSSPCCAPRPSSAPRCTTPSRATSPARLVPTMMGFDPLVQFLHEVGRDRRASPGRPARRPGHLQHRRRRGAPALDGHQARGAHRACPSPTPSPRPSAALGWVAQLVDAPPIVPQVPALPLRGRRAQGAGRAGLHGPAYTTREALPRLRRARSACAT